jgi:hypothetical protein
LPIPAGAIFEQHARARPPRDSRGGSTPVSIFGHFGPLGARRAGYEAIHMIRKANEGGGNEWYHLAIGLF